MRSPATARRAASNQQLKRRTTVGGAVCVRVEIRDDNINVSLTTPGCPSGGSGRSPTPREAAILALWRKHHLDAPGFTGGDLVAFLKDLRP